VLHSQLLKENLKMKYTEVLKRRKKLEKGEKVNLHFPDVININEVKCLALVSSSVIGVDQVTSNYLIWKCA
jgi:hypothetical protein